MTQFPPAFLTKLADLDIEALQKGDYLTQQQVEVAYRVLDPKLDENIQRYERGELLADPLTFVAVNMAKYIERVRQEMGAAVVCRGEHGGIRVLTDAEAVDYLDSQANAGLKKHKNKTTQMYTSVDVSNLSEYEQRKLTTNQRKHSFILASTQTARAQAAKLTRQVRSLADHFGPR